MTTNPMFNPQPNYSGVTIQIANPTVYGGGKCGGAYQESPYSYQSRNGIYGGNPNQYADSRLPYNNINGNREAYYNYQRANGQIPYDGLENYPAPYNYNPEYAGGYSYIRGVGENGALTENQISELNGRTNFYPNHGNQYGYQSGMDSEFNQGEMPKQGQSYPPQYYLNNYNYQNNGVENGEKLAEVLNDLSKNNKNKPVQTNPSKQIQQSESVSTEPGNDYIRSINGKTAEDYMNEPEKPQDFTKSQAVITDLDARAAAAEAEKKNSTQKKVVALTDEYIKSLENYLNNPNDEIRLMASKEILTRLDEDKDRYDDAALNALLNKMLQDPSKLIRIAALSAFASQLASGNDYTVTLLHNIQQNPSADKEDVLQAADILLKMSAGTEVKNIPNPAVKENSKESKG